MMICQLCKQPIECGDAWEHEVCGRRIRFEPNVHQQCLEQFMARHQKEIKEEKVTKQIEVRDWD